MRNKTIDYFKKTIHEHPIFFLICVASIVRIIAVVFSKGYMAYDDHFCVIEYANRLIKTGSLDFLGSSPKRSFFYPGLIYLIIKSFYSINISNPEIIMFFIRVLHALFSLLAVVIGYKFARLLADKRTGLIAGLIISLHFTMPFLSVRQLNENVSSVFLLIGLYLAYLFSLKGKKDIIMQWFKYPNSLLFLSGISLGLAFAVRFQTAICTVAIILYYLLWKKNIKASLLLGSGFLLVLLLQGFLDLILFKKFSITVINYFLYNLKHSTAFVTGPWYNYLLLILCIFIPPFSFLFCWGIIKSFKSSGILTLPTAAFFVLHSIFPGKQERFLIPILPLLIIMGVVGLHIWKNEKGSYHLKNNILKKLWYYFWIFNTIILVPCTLNYSQKARIEPLIYLNSKDNIGGIIFDMTEVKTQIPIFYFMKETYYSFKNEYSEFKDLSDMLALKENNNKSYYIVIFTDKRVSEHTENIKKYIKNYDLKLEKQINPSLNDYILHKMNPRFNKAKRSWIYKLTPKL